MKSFTFQCRTPFFRVMSALTLSLPLVLLMGLFSGQAQAVCPLSGFEDDDGNLDFVGTCTDDPPTDSVLDWNDFAAVQWDEGTAPYRIADEVFSGWSITALEDAQATTSDTAFAGGTKQDDNCAVLKGAKAPNKDDLKRVYISSSTVDGNVILNLGWVRIPQNTTSPSAHIGFEFNQGETPCPGSNSDGLVQRTVGDMLIVYDFEGGATDTPTITLRRWVDSGACEVGSNSPPCWGASTNLTELGFAEARVNTSVVGPVGDDLTPPPSPATASVSETLQLNEFGEAGIDLTGAGVFDANVCLAFGKAFAVSRSSGNSAQAQMKDLVGPGDVNIANCGAVIIRKVTDPSPDPTATSFAYTTTGGLDPSSFSLQNGQSKDYGTTVFAGAYSVTETDPDSLGFDFISLDCSASSTSNGTTIDTSVARTVSFDLKPLDTVDCTYLNRARGEIAATKVVVNACDAEDGGLFTLRLDGAAEATNVGDGGGFGPLEVTLGGHTVGEVAGSGTDLANYTATIGGDCASDGSVTVGAGDSKSCTITNVRRPTVTINKVVTGGSLATFDLIINDGNDATVERETQGQGNGGTTGALVITTSSGSGAGTTYGPVLVGETVANGPGNTTIGSIDGFQSFWSCDDTGTTTEIGTSVELTSLLPGEDVTCTVTNIPVAPAACTPIVPE
ncbi:prealbumin-like fold domain-containing protein [Pseudomonas sp. SP16.1]|uniref:prealbumin-like fold domain-containing protein n=1 Tax=Pseudomonas sp. SP16.1 TaxID=3458854 RepID=UPI0040466497